MGKSLTSSPYQLTIAALCVAAPAVLCFLLISVFAATTASVYWHSSNTGLTTQDVEDLVAAPSSPAALYAGTWGNGIFRSLDHGATWVAANTGITLPMHVQGGLAVNPVIPTTLYAGDYYGGGLYRSADGGDSWTLSLPDAVIRAVAINPVTPTIVLAGDREEGLYRSADDGTSWMPISAAAGLTDPHVRTLAFASSAPNVAYAGASQYAFYSNDAGQTWTAQGTLSSNIYALAVHPVTPSLVYVGTYAHGLHRSDDWGANWAQLNNGLPSSAWVTSLAIHPVTPTILYAGTWGGQVYRSVDSGDSWEGLGYLGYVYDVLVHPTAPSVIYAATSSHGVFRGGTLDHLSIEPISSPQYVLQTFPITLTACDELGLPLGGFNSTTVLTDTTSTITPTLAVFTDGVAVVEVSAKVETKSDVITATIPSGPVIVSNSFDVMWTGKTYLPLVMRNQ